MGTTAIEWTDATWNPVTGCAKVSVGCKNCYAERLFVRIRHVGGGRDGGAMQLGDRVTSIDQFPPSAPPVGACAAGHPRQPTDRLPTPTAELNPMTETAVLANPFDDTRMVPATSAAAQTDQHRAIAEVQAAMVVARANPRNQRVAMDRILNACQRQGLAEAAVYSYSRGGTDISGPSIRLAEAIAQNWGNMQFGIRELEQGNGVSTVQVFAWDVETNTRREVTFQVRHERHTKSGKWDMPDDDAMRAAHARLVAELREKPTRALELFEVAQLVQVQRREGSS